MSPVQVNGYCEAVVKMLKAENGSGEKETETEAKEKSAPRFTGIPELGVPGSQREMRFEDEEVKKRIEKRKGQIEKKHGKNVKMSFLDILETGAFAYKD